MNVLPYSNSSHRKGTSYNWALGVGFPLKLEFN